MASKQSVLAAVARALEAYEDGRVDPAAFSSLLEKLGVVLEAVAGQQEEDGDDESVAFTDVTGSAFLDQDDVYTSQDGHSPAGTRQRYRAPGGVRPSVQPQPAQHLVLLQERERELERLHQENARLQLRVADLSKAVAAEAQRAGDAEARLEAREREREREEQALGRVPAPELQRGQEQRLLGDLAQYRLANDSLKQQLADCRAELAAAQRANAAGASRAEAVLMGELEQQRQVAAMLRRDLQKASAAAAREKEVLAQEAKHWQLAANQAAAVAERAQKKVSEAEQKAEAQAAQARSHAGDVLTRSRELAALQQQLNATRAALAQRTRYLERLDGAVLQPLLTWHAEADPAVAAALVGAMVNRGGPRSPSQLPRSRDFVQLKFRAEAVLGAAAADVDAAAERHAQAAAAAFEALASRIAVLKQEAEVCGVAARSQVVEAESRHNRAMEELRTLMSQQLRGAQEQMQNALEAKAQLREALAAEQASGAVRTSELQRLSEREVRLTLQVEQLTAELSRTKHEAARALKDQEDAAEAASKQRCEAAFERGRTLGDRQAAAAIQTLKAELQEAALQLQAARHECASLASQLEEARTAAESFDARLSEARQEAHRSLLEAEERLRRDGDARLAEAKAAAERRAEMDRQDAALALQREKDRCERALADARRAGEVAAEAARREGELALQRQAGEAELQLRSASAQLTSQLRLTEERHLLAAQEAERRIAAMEEELRLSGDRAAAAQDKCEQLIKQVYDATQELQKTRQALADAQAEAAAAAQESAAQVGELQSKLLDCRQRLAHQSRQLEALAEQQAQEQAHEVSALRAALDHASCERDALQAEVLALTQQLSAAQAAAAGVEVEMDTLASALEAHKAARAAAEAAAEEARRSAAAAATAAEDGAERLAGLQAQLGEAQRLREREVALLERRCQSDLEAAEARFRGELEAMQARLQLLRLKQSRVMSYVDDVFHSVVEEEAQQLAHERAEEVAAAALAGGGVLGGGQAGPGRGREEEGRARMATGTESWRGGGPRGEAGEEEEEAWEGSDGIWRDGAGEAGRVGGVGYGGRRYGQQPTGGSGRAEAGSSRGEGGREGQARQGGRGTAAVVGRRRGGQSDSDSDSDSDSEGALSDGEAERDRGRAARLGAAAPLRAGPQVRR